MGASVRIEILPRDRKRTQIVCPVCNANAIIRTSLTVTPLAKDIYCRCTNDHCGMTWKAQMSFVYVLSPSGIDREDLDLPMAPPEIVRTIYSDRITDPPDGRQIDLFGA